MNTNNIVKILLLSAAIVGVAQALTCVATVGGECTISSGSCYVCYFCFFFSRHCLNYLKIFLTRKPPPKFLEHQQQPKAVSLPAVNRRAMLSLPLVRLGVAATRTSAIRPNAPSRLLSFSLWSHQPSPCSCNKLPNQETN